MCSIPAKNCIFVQYFSPSSLTISVNLLWIWKNVPQHNKGKNFKFLVFRQKSKFWHSDKTGWYPSAYVCQLLYDSSWPSMRSGFGHWPTPQIWTKMTNKNLRNFHKIANFDILTVWAACQHSIASLCNISALPVSLSLRYGFGYEKKYPKIIKSKIRFSAISLKIKILKFRQDGHHPGTLVLVCDNFCTIPVGHLWDLVSDMDPPPKSAIKWQLKIGLIFTKFKILIF